MSIFIRRNDLAGMRWQRGVFRVPSGGGSLRGDEPRGIVLREWARSLPRACRSGPRLQGVRGLLMTTSGRTLVLLAQMASTSHTTRATQRGSLPEPRQ